MEKKSIVMLFVAACLSSSVFATSFINHFSPKHKVSTSTIVKKHKATKSNRAYTDFTGTWTSNCYGEQMTLSIENDSDYISIFGDERQIGPGLQGMTESNNEWVNFNHESYEWNENGSALVMKAVNVSKENTDNSAIETQHNSVTLSMQNQNMIVDGEFSFSDDAATDKPMTFQCIFKKQ